MMSGGSCANPSKPKLSFIDLSATFIFFINKRRSDFHNDRDDPVARVLLGWSNRIVTYLETEYLEFKFY